MGYEPLTKYVVFLVVAVQFATAFFLRGTHPLSWKFLLAAYAIGGTANQNLFLAVSAVTALEVCKVLTFTRSTRSRTI
jgi:sphingolipid delta-4 desaturase